MTEYDEAKKVAQQKEQELFRKYAKAKEKMKALENELAQFGWGFPSR